MFDEEICAKCGDVKVVWYPGEKVCLVVHEKRIMIYSKIPSKYCGIFEDRSKDKGKYRTREVLKNAS